MARKKTAKRSAKKSTRKKRSGVKPRVHFHDGGSCSGSSHHSSCAGKGREATCCEFSVSGVKMCVCVHIAG
jgi:hypothetical protein